MRTLLFSLFALLTLNLNAQDKEFGLTLGLIAYQGDLNYETSSLKGSGAVAGLVYRDFAGEKFAIKGGLNIGSFSGEDSNFVEEARDRRFSFKTNFVELQGQFEFYPFAKGSYEGGIFKRRLNPFAGVGLSLLMTGHEVSDAGGRIEIKPEDREENRSSILLPVSLGLRFDMTEKVTLSGSVTAYPISNDYLDGISASANPDIADYIATGQISLAYKFGGAASSRYNLD